MCYSLVVLVVAVSAFNPTRLFCLGRSVGFATIVSVAAGFCFTLSAAELRFAAELAKLIRDLTLRCTRIIGVSSGSGPVF